MWCDAEFVLRHYRLQNTCHYFGLVVESSKSNTTRHDFELLCVCPTQENLQCNVRQAATIKNKDLHKSEVGLRLS